MELLLRVSSADSDLARGRWLDTNASHGITMEEMVKKSNLPSSYRLNFKNGTTFSEYSQDRV
jgi:hypothetical protein